MTGENHSLSGKTINLKLVRNGKGGKQGSVIVNSEVINAIKERIH